MIKRDEADNNYSNGDPHEQWLRYAGREWGYAGNNGTSKLDENASIWDRRAASGTGAFRNGSTYGAGYSDFAQSLDPVNSYAQGSSAGAYTVQHTGDTLSGIAQALWGDSFNKEAYFADVAARAVTPDEKADVADLQARLVAERARLDRAYAYADRQTIDMIGAVYGGVDFAKGAWRLGHGEVNLENSLSVLFGMAGAAGGLKVVRPLVFAERGTPTTWGIAFENSGVAAARAEAFLPGESVRRLSVRAFDDAGNLLPGRTVLDVAGNRGTGQLGALEFKLHEGVSLTARQAQHFPYLARNGGVVVGRNGEDALGLFAGARIGPLTVQRIDGPTLPLTWWPK